MTARRAAAIWIAILIVLLIAVPIVLPWFIPPNEPWCLINRGLDEIDITTGKARSSRHVWFVKIHERVSDTCLSKALGGERVDIGGVEPWRSVIYHGGWHVHYVFHGALSQAGELERIFEVLQATPERRRDIAREILRLWQTGRSDRAADDFIDALWEEGLSKLEEEAARGPR